MSEFYDGCGDGGCLIKRPEGQHTNGGCQCLRDLPTATRIAVTRRLQKLKEVAGALTVAIDELDDLGADVSTMRRVRDEAYELF